MLVVPDLAQNSVSIVRTVLASSCSIISWPRTAKKRNATVLLKQRVPEIRIAVGCTIRRLDSSILEPCERWETLVEFDCCLEKIYYIFVLAIKWAVARDIESAEASCVFAKLVGPEAFFSYQYDELLLLFRNVTWVVLLPGDPVSVHVLKQIVTTKRLEESADVWSSVGHHSRSVLQPICSVGAGNWIVLPVQVAILRIIP